MNLKLILASLLFGCAGPSLAGTREPLAGLRLEDLAGHLEPLSVPIEAKAVVFLFVSVDCPISNSYAPEFSRLRAEFGPKNVLLRLVYPNLDESTEAVIKHIKEFDLALPALRDPHHDLVKASQVHNTPEAAVFVPKAGLVYHGRIDNRYADLGVARPEATQHDLKEALLAILNGKPVQRKSTHAVGCSISPLP